MLRPQSTTLGYRLQSVAGRYRTGYVANRASTEGLLPNKLIGPRAGAQIKSSLCLTGPAARSVKMARLEAVLLIAREPLPTRKLAQLASLADGTEARTLVRQLGKLYDQQGAAFCVEEMAGGFQLMTRPQFAIWLRRLFQRPDATQLSTPAMETLSVVAYRQPVLRADIEAIRGVGCGEILRQLMDRDMVKITGRSEELGRPFLYGTSRQFLLAFGLRHLDELPRAEQLRGVGIEQSARTEQQDTEQQDVEESEVRVTAINQPPNDESESAEFETEEEHPLSPHDDSGYDDNEIGDDDADDDEYDDEYEDDEDDEDEYDDEIEESAWEEVVDDDVVAEDDDDSVDDEFDDDDFEYEEESLD